MESNSNCLSCGASSKQLCSCNLSFSNDFESSTIQNTQLRPRNPPQSIEIKRRNHALDGIQLELFEYREKVQATLDSYEDIHRILISEVSVVLNIHKSGFFKLFSEIDSKVDEIEEIKRDSANSAEILIEKFKANSLKGILSSYQDIVPINISTLTDQLCTRLGLNSIRADADRNELQDKLDDLQRKYDQLMQDQQYLERNKRLEQEALYNSKEEEVRRLKDLVSKIENELNSLQKDHQTLINSSTSNEKSLKYTIHDLQKELKAHKAHKAIQEESKVNTARSDLLISSKKVFKILPGKNIYAAKDDTRDLVIYNVNTSKISTTSLDIRNKFCSSSTCILPNNNILIVGGKDSNLCITGDTYEIDLSQIPPIVFKLKDLNFSRFGAKLICCEDKVYCLGGWNNTMIKNTETSRESSSIFSFFRKPKVTSPLSNSNILITKQTFTNKCEAMTIGKSSWQMLPDMIVPRADFGLVTMNKKIFIIGGTNCDSVEYYDINLNTFSLVASLGIRCFGNVCGVIDDRIYLVGRDLFLLSNEFKMITTKKNICDEAPYCLSNVVVKGSKIYYINSDRNKVYSFEVERQFSTEIKSF